MLSNMFLSVYKNFQNFWASIISFKLLFINGLFNPLTVVLLGYLTRIYGTSLCGITLIELVFRSTGASKRNFLNICFAFNF